MKIRVHFGFSACALLLFAFAQCAGPQSSALPPKSAQMGRQVLPLPPEALISFTEAGGEVLRNDTQASVRRLNAAPANFGRPIAANVDLGSLMAAVVHQRGLALLNLTSPEVEPVWLELPWSTAPTSVFVADAYAATLGGSEACIWDLTNAKLACKIDLAAWSKQQRLGPAVCAVPDRTNPKRATVLFSSPQSTDLQVLDFSRGDPELVASASNLFRNTGLTWHLVERCAYDGDSLFLSGTKEASGTNASGQVVPLASPFLVRVDLATREYQALASENTHARDQGVEEIAAAGGRVATLRRDGLLRVFRGSTPVFERQERTGRAIAWLSESRLAIFDAGSIDVIEIP